MFEATATEARKKRLIELRDALLREAQGLPQMKIMEFCGGHTHALVNSGVLSVLPPNIKMVHGPGCPVCVLPAHHLQALIDLLETRPGLTLGVYGDLMRIPTLGGDSLLQAKGRGYSVRMLYSPLELLAAAQTSPEKEFLFVAIGFETTAPATAVLLERAKEMGLKNLSVLCLHVMTPPAIHAVMEALEPQERPHALIGPGHVSIVTGLELYEKVARDYRIPVVISGFESTDLLESLLMTVKLLSARQTSVANQYVRALKREGNRAAQALLERVFELRPTFVWRGLGEVKDSAYRLKEEWAPWDAEKRYALSYREVPEHPQCQCGWILRAKKTPADCKLFMKGCTPTRPMGACMVSSEGACHAYYLSGMAGNPTPRGNG